MNPGFLAGILGASVLSSLHCAGMCGPFVAFYSAGATSPRPHLVYHLQRALTYTTLGAIAGALGSGLDALGEGLGTLRIAALVASVLTVLWGVMALVPRLSFGRLFPSFLPGRLIQLKSRAPTTKAFVLGLSTPLLPCGTLYAFVTLAAGTGSAANGALTMFTFFVGTLPGLVGLGALTTRLGSWLGARLPRLLGAALVVIGFFGVYERSQSLLNTPADADAKSCHGHH
jgi:uncharacterized protein